ncbi:hypothetical protein FORMB_13540 [Formosa sp. Hel1_33_131]|jgi:hypothetical protein|uniref:hypothetical protein n=1 Tax=Formosa sp. Hel1_33_131 TaxID=1336794 RepID=UPI00084E1CE4|nr:hypothetical protein [Formosa sp. Hel1_33_131]AOR28398.1 hypothetical protein FORMB_13540 [Formosa sp. Hel1_33_131]
MTHIEEIRQSIIDKLLSINSEELLSAFNKILESKSEDFIQLTKEQKEMLQMGKDDIVNGRMIPQSEVDKMDAEWLG